MTTASQPPVFVIGMHRSGTTMVTRVLEELGVFMGEGLLHNAEHELVVRLNDWLLWQGSAAWDRPTAFKDVLENDAVRELAADYLRTILGSPRSAPFVGRSRALRGQTVTNLDEPWGLKDPRMTFTLPVWLELWPDARVISVTRHGVDVAASLQVRALRKVQEYGERYRRLRRGYLLKPKHTRMARLVPTLRCTSLDGAFSLWEEYDDEVVRRLEAPSALSLHLRYEDLLADPVAGVRQIAEFCRIDATEERVLEIGGAMDAGRGLAYRSKPELRAFAERPEVAATLERHGYGVVASVSPR